MSDYYSILGVSPTATRDDIKSAFRRLAKDLHPDVNSGSDATRRFQEVSEAYNVLSDKEKRAHYDARRANPAWGQPDIDDWVRGFWGGDPFEDFVIRRGRSRKTRFRQKVSVKVPITLAAKGGLVNVNGVTPVPIKVMIERDTKQGSRISVTSGGEDFDLVVELVSDRGFSMRGDNVETSVNINMVQAVLGCVVRVTSPKDETFDLKVPKGISAGTLLSLQGQGLAGSNLLVRVNIDIPKELSDEALSALKDFATKAGLAY